MENKRVYQIDLYEVKIGSRIGKITVQYFKDENLFFCKFMNDKYSDFINSYESFGFMVDITEVNTKFNTNGKFTQEEALNVWDQIEREGKPIKSTFITI
ncbi:MAG: hypothetical protein WCI48_07445 [Bacteroidota bacterium]